MMSNPYYISTSSSSSSPSASSSSQLQSTLLLSYSLSGKLHTINENPFEELYEQDQFNLDEFNLSHSTASTCCSDSDSDHTIESDQLEDLDSPHSTSPLVSLPPSSSNMHKSRYSATTLPRPKTLLLHAAQSQHYAHSPPSSWRFPRTSPSQNYALSVLRYAYALSSFSQNTTAGVARDVIWSSGTRWY